MIVTKPFDVTKIPRCYFENQRSYEAAVYGIELMNKVLKLKKEGYLVMEDGKVFDPGFEIHCTKKSFQAYAFECDGMSTKGCRIFFIGSTLGGPNYDKAYVTKKEMREWFKKYRFIKKSDILNLLKV